MTMRTHYVYLADALNFDFSLSNFVHFTNIHFSQKCNAEVSGSVAMCQTMG